MPTHLVQPRDPGDFLPVKPVVLHILFALAKEELHGYGLIRAIRERTDGRLKVHTGPLYRHLHRLLSDGLVEEVADGPLARVSDPRRGSRYRLTELGRGVARAEVARLEAVVDQGRSLDLAT